MKRTMAKASLSLLLTLALLMCAIPGFAVSAETTVRKFSDVIGTPLYADAGITFAAYGDQGLKATSTAGGAPAAILGFEKAVLDTTPYLRLEMDHSTLASKGDDIPAITMQLGYWSAGVDTRKFFYQSTPITQITGTCINLKEFAGEINDALYITLTLYVVSNGPSSVEFSKLYLTSEKEEVRIDLKTTQSNTAYTDMGYWNLGEGIELTKADAGITITHESDEAAGDVNRAIWAGANSLLDIMPYLVFEVDSADIDNINGFQATRLWAGDYESTEKRDIEVKEGVNCIDMKTLLSTGNDTTAGYFYLWPSLDDNTSVTFKQFYLTNTPPADADMTELSKAVSEAKALDLTKYVDNQAKEDFKASLKAAETLLANIKASQASVDEAAANLNTKMAAMTKVGDTSVLSALVKRLSKLSESAYTKETYSALKAKVDEAKELMTKGALQAEIDAMVTALQTAEKALKPKASGQTFMFKPTKSAAADFSDGGWMDALNLSYKKHGDIGLSMTYDGKSQLGYGNVIYAIPVAQVKKTPYMVFEIDQTALDAATKMSIIIGYGIGAEHVEYLSSVPANSVTGCYAVNIPELLKGKKDEAGYVYINMCVVGSGEATVDYSRLYLSSSNADRSKMGIDFLPTASDGSLMDGGYYAVSEEITVAPYGIGGIAITGTEVGDASRALYAFPVSVLQNSPYFAFEIADGVENIAHIKISSPWDDNKNGIEIPVKAGENRVNLNEVLKDATPAGYVYIAITMKNGTVNFKSMALEDEATVNGGGNNPTTGEGVPATVIVVALASVVMLGALTMTSRKSRKLAK